MRNFHIHTQCHACRAAAPADAAARSANSRGQAGGLPRTAAAAAWQRLRAGAAVAYIAAGSAGTVAAWAAKELRTQLKEGGVACLQAQGRGQGGEGR